MIMILIIEDIKLIIYVPPENGFAEGYSKQFIIINMYRVNPKNVRISSSITDYWVLKGIIMIYYI